MTDPKTESTVPPVFSHLDLKPLSYHTQISDWLSTNEPKVWQWFADLKTLDKSFDNTRKALLKETYRLTPESHKEVYDICHLAMQRLGIEAPVTIYQANDGSMNAALYYIPGEIHIVLFGALIEKLSDKELLALLGHELSHYLLWSMDDSRYLVTHQLLEDSVAQAPQNNAMYETARLFGLHTEIFADRGAVIAAQDYSYSIAVLVKVMTGLSSVAPDAFLKQAKELDEQGNISDAKSHPESYLRALFVDKWQTLLIEGSVTEEDVDSWVLAKLKGKLTISSLDLLDQAQITKETAAFFRYLLQDTDLESELVTSQISLFFADWDKRTAILEIEPFKNKQIDDSIKEYFIALIFDIAFADTDQTDVVLAKGAEIAYELGWLDLYKTKLKTLLKITKRKADKLTSLSSPAKPRSKQTKPDKPVTASSGHDEVQNTNKQGDQK